MSLNYVIVILCIIYGFTSCMFVGIKVQTLCLLLMSLLSQVIGCEDRLRNDLYCVEWGVKLYSN